MTFDENILSAQKAFNENDMSLALNLSNKAMLQNPSSAIPYYFIALTLQQADDNSYHTIEWNLLKAKQLMPDWAQPYNALGLLYANNNNNIAAIQMFKLAFSLNNDWVEPAYNIGETLRVFNGDLQEAMGWFTCAIKIEPNFANSYFGIGGVLKKEKKYEEAKSWIKKAIYLNDKNNYFYSGLADCYRMLNQHDEAIGYYQNAILLPGIKSNKISLTNLGFCFQVKGQYEKAIEYYDKVLALEYNYEESMIGKAWCLNVLDKTSEAIDMLNRSLTINQYSASACLGMGNCLIKLEEYEKAIEWYNRAFNLAPTFPNALNGLGDCYFYLKDYYKAIEIYDKAIMLDDDWDMPYAHKGDCYEKLGYHIQAIKYYNISITKNLKQGYSYRMLGHVYRQMGLRQVNEEQINSYRLAKHNYSLALKYDPDDELPWLHLSTLPHNIFGNDEIYGQPLFNKFLLQLRSKTIKNNLELIVKQCLAFGSPLLWTRIVDNIRDVNLDSYSFIKELDTVIKISAPFRNHFELQKFGGFINNDQVYLEAILNYHAGNPLKTYELFSSLTFHDEFNVDFSCREIFYYIKSAKEVLADNLSVLHDIALKNVLMVSNTLDNEVSNYYCAMILIELDEPEKAKNILQRLGTAGHMPSKYQLTECIGLLKGYKSLHCQEKISSLVADQLTNPDYFSHPKEIMVFNSWKRNDLKRFSALFFYFENITALTYVEEFRNSSRLKYNEPVFNQDYFFIKQLHFESAYSLSEYSDKEQENAIFKATKLVYGIKTSFLPKLNYYKELRATGSDIIDEFGTEIHSNSFTLYTYIKADHPFQPKKFNFIDYLQLLANLQKDKLITKFEFSLLSEYVIYCAEKVAAVKPNNEFLKLVVEQIKGYIPIAAVLGVGIGTAESVLKFALHKIRKPRSELISFSEFKEQIEQRDRDS